MPTPFISHGVLTAGTEGKLTCSYSLSPAVDTHTVDISATWTVNGSSVTGDERISTDKLSLTLLLSLPLTLAHTPVLSPSHPSHHMSLYWDHQSRASQKQFMCTVRPIIALMFFNNCDLLLGAHPVVNFKNTAVSESSLSFSWSQPSIAGNLTTGYNLTCVPLLTGIPLPQSLKLAPTATSATVA